MKEEFGHKAPLVRLALAVVALSISIGGFIEFLATGYSEVAVSKHGRVVVAATAS